MGAHELRFLNFTCFTGTKVQVLTLQAYLPLLPIYIQDGFLAARPTLGVHTAKARLGDSERDSQRAQSDDSRRAQSEAPKAAEGWRGVCAKSGLLGMETAADVGEWVREVLASSTQVLSLLALLVQKYK